MEVLDIRSFKYSRFVNSVIEYCVIHFYYTFCSFNIRGNEQIDSKLERQKQFPKTIKMESTLFVFTKLTFSENLRCSNLPLLVGAVSQKRCSPKLVLLLQAKISIAGNSNILNILRMSTLQGQIILNPF